MIPFPWWPGQNIAIDALFEPERHSCAFSAISRPSWTYNWWVVVLLWLKRAHRSQNSSLFILCIPLVLLLFSTKIDAKTASTTVSDDNQLAMGLIETTEWLIVGWGLCRGIKMASTTTIMVKNRVYTFLWAMHPACVYRTLNKSNDHTSSNLLFNTVYFGFRNHLCPMH